MGQPEFKAHGKTLLTSYHCIQCSNKQVAWLTQTTKFAYVQPKLLLGFAGGNQSFFEQSIQEIKQKIICYCGLFSMA